MRLLGSIAVIALIGCAATDDTSPYSNLLGDRPAAGDVHSDDGATTDGGDDTTHSDRDGATNDGGDDSGAGDFAGGDLVCPPCVPPPSEDCVGSGPCGCGPYQCPGDGDRVCAENVVGWCPSDVGCECCPAGGPTNNCLCTTTCTSDDDCTDADRPLCNQVSPGATGMCTNAEFFCCWMCL